jgi:hypothetical protein
MGLYEITGHLGSGGMGEVYRARDTKLGREVAIKVMPDELARDAERLARFEREARVLAALNHGNIATLYGAETEAGAGFLVMELVEGETLADRIERGALPVGEALPLFLQIAEGLEAAHARGVIHRDLKPANLKINLEGVAKILDFGLAKALAPEPAAASGDAALSASPTLTLQATRRGEILGTAAYMSPEQARGLESDPRADVWGFGCCLYEALTGRRPFSGEDAAQTLASVLKDEPDWSALPAELPANVAVLLRRCLEKSRRSRLQSIADARLELAETLAAPARLGPLAGAATSHAEPRPAQTRRWTAAAVSSLAALVVGLAAGYLLRDRGAAPPSSAAEPTHVSIEVPVDLDIGTASEESNLRLSRDGRILYVMAGRGSDRQIHARPLAERSFRPIEGTAGLDDTGFAISPDGEWVGFVRDRTLWKVRAEGGVPVPLHRTSDARLWNAHWGDDGFVYFTPGSASGIQRVSEDGGEVEIVTTPNPTKGEVWHDWPLLLPDGGTVLFRVTFGNAGHLEAVSLATGERRELGVGDYARPLYASPTLLVYALRGEVFAAPFDARTARLAGRGVPVMTDVETDASGEYTVLALSESGTLAYLPRQGLYESRLAWKDRSGARVDVDLEAALYGGLHLAPDGKSVALERSREARWEILTLDLARGVTDTIVANSFGNTEALFSPTGREIAYASTREGDWDLYVMGLDAAGEPRQVHASPSARLPRSWSPDGRFLAYRQRKPDEDHDLWAVALDQPEPTPFPIADSAADENWAEFSPDGKWIAYESARSGRHEIYVARFDADARSVGRPERVSSEGGWQPVWSRDGRELFFRDGKASAIMKVDVLRSEPELELGAPQVLFEEREMFAPSQARRNYDVAPDGRFLMLVRARQEQPTIHVVLNWLAELERQLK